MNKSTFTKLKNGLSIYLERNDKIESVSIQLVGLAGSNYEDINQICAAHFTEHWLLNNNYSHITALGGKIIGITSRDTVTFSSHVLKENLSDALLYLLSIFNKKLLDSASFVKVKTAIIPEITRQYDIPEKITSWISYSKLFENTRLSIPNIGNTQYLKDLTETNVRNFYDKTYKPNRFVLSIYGNINITKVMTEITKICTTYTHQINTESLKLVPNNNFPQIETLKVNSFSQNYIMCSYKLINTNYQNVYKYLVLASIIQSQLKTTTQKFGVAYKTSCDAFISLNYGVFSLFATCDKNNLNKVIKLFNFLIENYTKTITQKVFITAKNKLIADIVFSQEKPYLHALNNAENILFTHKPFDIHNEKKLIQQLRHAEILKVAKNIFKNKPTISTL